MRDMRERTRSGQLGEWQRLKSALEANLPELAHLETYRAQFETLLGRTEDLFQNQAALAASKQETSQQLAAQVAECARLATVLRFCLKQFYGPTAEKLVEFGIQPFRGRAKKPPELPQEGERP